MAITALVCGIVSMFCVIILSWFTAGLALVLGLLTGIAAIVLGILGSKGVNNVGMAKAGFVLGIIGVALSLIFLVSCVACVACIASSAPAGAFSSFY